jgi:predicted phosphoribosyltransferase
MFFQDRNDAGRQLAPMLDDLRGAADTLVLGLPRGGVVVAMEVALALDLPLDVWVTRKIGAPSNPELAIGSIDSNGNLLLDESIIRLYEVSDRYVREEAEIQRAEIERRYLKYRGSADAPDITGKDVIVVDDGVATGYTMLAALRSIRSNGAASVTCAVPVASPRVINSLEAETDRVECWSSPSYFSAVGEFYKDFQQVSDEQVLECLRRAHEA